MKKKLFAMLLTLCMVLTLLPTAALASAGGTPQTTLPQAVNNVITLTSDVTLSQYAIIRASDNVTTLDLDGHTLSFAGTGNFPATLYVNGGNLLIKNGTITNAAAYALSVYGGATVTLDNVDIEGATLGVNVGDANGAGTLTVTNGSTITGKTVDGSNNGDGIRVYCGEVTIKSGCTVTASSSGTGIESYRDAKVTIEEDASVSGHIGVEIYGGTLESAGTITGTDGSGITVSSNEPADGYAGEKTVIVTGGSVTGTTNAVVVHETAVSDSTDGTTDIDLQGGEFTGNVTVQAPADGTTTPATVEVGITGDTTKVTGDVVVEGPAEVAVSGGEITGSVTVDNANADVSISDGTVGKVEVADGSDLTITGGSFSDPESAGEYIDTTTDLDSTADTTTSTVFTTYTISNAIGGMTYIVQTAADDDSAVSYISIVLPMGATEFKFTVPNDSTVNVWETATGLGFGTSGEVAINDIRTLEIK